MSVCWDPVSWTPAGLGVLPKISCPLPTGIVLKNVLWDHVLCWAFLELLLIFPLWTLGPSRWGARS